MSYRNCAPFAALVMGGLWACQESVTTVEVYSPPVVTEPSVVAKPYVAPTCPERVPDLLGAGARTKGRMVVVFKHDYLLGFYVNGQLARLSEEEGASSACFPVAMGDNPYTAKTVEDRASTPEGWYRVGGKVPLGVSHYHQALAVSYPNGEDAERAFAAGIINSATRDQIKRADKAKRMPPQFTAMGGQILILPWSVALEGGDP